MTKIINDDYSLNFHEFQTAHGVYKIVGTDGTPDKAKDTIDEWRHGSNYVKITRDQLLQRQKQEKIKPVEK